MKRQTKQVAWIVVLIVLAIGGLIGIQAFGQFARMEHGALEACHAYLEDRTGEKIDLERLETSAIEVVFPKPFDKRFRSTCTYGEVSVAMEATPFEDWTIISTIGLD